MRRTVKTEKKPIKLWLDGIEEGAMAQARNLANLPFVFSHVAIMPDAHVGYGMPIGGVLAVEDVVIPNAVGVDIGCGVCAVRTSLPGLSQDKLKMILAAIRATVPLGFAHHKRPQDPGLMPKAGFSPDLHPVVAGEYRSALTQLGTLGGGNHFIEIQHGSDGHLWLMVHSGSRNLGFKVAGYYNRLAENINRKAQSLVPPAWQLAFLAVESRIGQDYLREMNYCVDFAFANRRLIMERVKEAVQLVAAPVFFEPMLNIAHNYAAYESHFGQGVMVHRKGATRVRAGELGIIPGSQGSPSYIVRGLGNPESFESCAHGAGRRMGRKEAIRKLDLISEKKRLDDQGIIHAIRSKSDLEEATGAYKDIAQVMEDQLDLVEKVNELRPMAVLKG